MLQRVDPAIEVSPILTHTRHDGLPVRLLKVPGSQSVHELALPVLCWPAGHSLLMLVPSHAEPAGHSEQLVRVVFVPPEVNQPAVHGSQLVAWFELHRLSAPQTSHPLWSARPRVPARQGAHDDDPAPEYVPASQAVTMLVPSHREPAGQGSHRDRVVKSPPEVNEPPGHVLHSLALALRYLSSLPQGVHSLEPAAA